MSSPIEPGSSNPNDLSYYAPRERAKSVSLSQEASSEPVRSPIAQPPSLDVRLKTPAYLRKPPTSEVIQKDPGLERELPRAALFGVASRFVAVAGFVTVVALFFALASPALRQFG